MIDPGVPFGWFNVDHAFCANRGHRSGIEREHALHGFVSGKVWILGAGSHHVECHVDLLKVLAPVGKAVSFGCACSHSTHVVLSRPDHPFGDVGSVNIRLSVLVFCIVLSNKILNIF